MSYRYYYFDDQTVGAEDLNRLVKLFVTDGVADNFENGIPYNVSKLGEVVSSNAGEGIIPVTNDTLKVTAEQGFAYIEPGVAFFKDGTVIEIETREQLNVPQGSAFYVYLKSDALKNTACPAVSADLPTDNTVPLAYVSETGEITDLRRFARGKVPSFYASDAGLYIDKVTEIALSAENLGEGKRVTLLPPGNSYRYLILICEKKYAHSDENRWTGVLIYDKETNMYYNFSKPSVNFDNMDYTSVGTGTVFKVVDCYFNARFQITGYLHFDDGKTELEMVKGPNATSDTERFNEFVFPFKIRVIAV